ncbi:hypothetical protein [Acaryochloris sp. IP29b_bin.148]|uniref:hypothetical protein n=1 Tax=Acaryochloris sp. IP29b_bin.148 TaxID=2969218 RepID=UPI00261ADC27|nr:hypothetical protein [Acaryochloris sp. IP29b_bin.148]
MSVVNIWKQSLAQLLAYYDFKRGDLRSFFPKLFLFFVVLNISCYWWAIMTAYPQEAFGPERSHYFLIQFPVGGLGALFDSLSFFITIHIARRALRATSTRSYLAHLSIDIIIAIVATWWVLLVFSISGWLVSLIQQSPESFTQRSYVYERRLADAVRDPTNRQSLKNIYFGVIMGISAFLPTLTHLTLSLRSIVIYQRQK